MRAGSRVAQALLEARRQSRSAASEALGARAAATARGDRASAAASEPSLLAQIDVALHSGKSWGCDTTDLPELVGGSRHSVYYVLSQPDPGRVCSRAPHHTVCTACDDRWVLAPP